MLERNSLLKVTMCAASLTLPARLAKAEAACEAGFLPTLCFHVDIKGSAVLSGSTSASVGSTSCAEWARGAITGKAKPGLQFVSEFTPVAGTAFALQGQIQDYKGPGTYTEDALAGFGTGFQIVTGDKTWENWSSETTPPKAKFGVHADGAGSLDFEGFVTDHAAPPPHDVISGSLTWTCVDPKS